MLSNTKSMGHKTAFRIGIVLLYFICVNSVFADTPVDSSIVLTVKEQPSVPKSYSSYLIRVVAVTGGIAGILLLIGLGIKKRFIPTDQSSFIKIHSRKYIGPKQYLTIISAEDKHILLGVTEQSISYLTTLENVTDSAAGEILEETPFLQILNKMRSR